MKYLPIFFLLIPIITFFCNCNPTKDQDVILKFQDENAKTYKKTLTLKASGTFNVLLDSSTGHFHNTFQAFIIENKPFLAFINSYNNSIYIISGSEGTTERIVRLENDGPNGILPNDNEGFFIKNFDSIFVFSDAKKELYIIDTIGKIYKKYIFTKRRNTMPYPSVARSHNITMANNIIYIPSNFTPYIHLSSEYKSSFSLDIILDSLNCSFEIPKVYFKACWGDNSAYNSYINPSLQDDKVVLSYSIVPYLFIVKNHVIIDSVYVASEYFDHINPYSLNINDWKKIRMEKRNMYDLTTPQFERLICDPYKQLYYWLTLARPLTEEEYKDPNWSKSNPIQFSVIILDKDFKKVGETLLPARRYKWKNNMIFVSEKGLNIPLYNQKSEESLEFEVYTINKL